MERIGERGGLYAEERAFGVLAERWCIAIRRQSVVYSWHRISHWVQWSSQQKPTVRCTCGTIHRAVICYQAIVVEDDTIAVCE